MSKRIQPSIAMLPMEDISKYLTVVKGFRQKDELAPDTKTVDGIPSNKIAVAALKEDGSLHTDRNTVENALRLNGIEATEYVTKADSDELLTDTHAVASVSANEFRNLRDEFYQLKGLLAKNGLIKNNYSYHGFQDAFKFGDIRYVDRDITRGALVETRASISDLTLIDTSELEIGEYIVVEDAGKKYITQISNKENDRIFIQPAIEGPFETPVVIKKALGMYYGGTFLFGEQFGQIITDKEKYIILNDDDKTGKMWITNPKHGALVNFRVPNSAAGAVTKATIKALVKGNPGSLTCYIAELDDQLKPKDVERDEYLQELVLPPIETMIENKTIIGQSKIIPASNASAGWNDLEFTFDRPVELEAQKRYSMIIVSSHCDEYNQWCFQTVEGPYNVPDLHRNIFLYTYRDDALTTKESNDLFFALTIKEVIKNNVGYLQEGLYTTQINLPEQDYATRARVELKVNREGKFKVIDNPISLIIKEDESINIMNEDKKQYTGSIFPSDTTVVVGNQISKVGTARLSNTYFSLAKETYAPANADVYRMGYKVVLKARKKTINYDSRNNPIEYKDTLVLDVPFTAVIPGKEDGKEGNSSDRLIFETDIAIKENSEYLLDGFNDFEVQVYWQSKGVTASEMYINPELAGSIFDITVSFDKSYSKKKNI